MVTRGIVFKIGIMMRHGLNEGCDCELLSKQNLNFTASLSYGKATGIYLMPPAYGQHTVRMEVASSFTT